MAVGVYCFQATFCSQTFMHMARDMNILVTGGTGFFGKALLKYWQGRGRRYIASARLVFLSRNPDKFINDNHAIIKDLDISIVKGDILVSDSLPNEKFTHILHAATDASHGKYLSASDWLEQISLGTKNILDHAVKTGARNFLLTSSGGVYGAMPDSIDSFSESYNGIPDPFSPGSTYGIGKRIAEHYVSLYQRAHDMNTTVARCFAFVGPDLPLDAHYAIGNFIADAVSQRDIVIKGDGTPIRTYMDQNDLAYWLTVMLTQESKGMRVYNVGSDVGISISELANLVAEVSATNVGVNILGNSTRSIDSERNRYVPNISKAKEELGLNLTVTLGESIANTIKELRERMR